MQILQTKHLSKQLSKMPQYNDAKFKKVKQKTKDILYFYGKKHGFDDSSDEEVFDQ